MKNKKSPLKFLGGALGAAGATAGTAFGTQLLGAGLSGLFGGGNIAARNNQGGGTSAGGSVAGIGSQVQPVADASTQFNPAAMQNMQGMFGDISGRQATLGASGKGILLDIFPPQISIPPVIDLILLITFGIVSNT